MDRTRGAGGPKVVPTPKPAPAPAKPAVASTGGNGTTPAPAPFLAEAQDTFQKLAPDVAANKLSSADARVLADATAKLGIIGEAEALRAAQKAEALSPADHAAFQALLAGASTPTMRAYLYKALGAGHTVAEVATFAKSIAKLTDAQLEDTLSLADDQAPVTGKQDGIAQQFDESCGPTTAQALRGEFDPIYALQLRQQDIDVHYVSKIPLTGKNQVEAQEQRHLLEDLGGGVARPRGQGGEGMMLEPAINAMAAYTGFTFDSVSVDQLEDPKGADPLLDLAAKQAAQGIPTPLRVTDAYNSAGHFVLCTAVEGTGPGQRFLIHDPWNGDTRWLTRAQIDSGKMDIASWNRLSHAYEATPAALAPAA